MASSITSSSPGAPLKAWLRSRRMRYGTLAQKLGCSTQTVTRWINGSRFPSRDDILRVAAITEGGVPPQAWYCTATQAQPQAANVEAAE